MPFSRWPSRAQPWGRTRRHPASQTRNGGSTGSRHRAVDASTARSKKKSGTQRPTFSKNAGRSFLPARPVPERAARRPLAVLPGHRGDLRVAEPRTPVPRGQRPRHERVPAQRRSAVPAVRARLRARPAERMEPVLGPQPAGRQGGRTHPEEMYPVFHRLAIDRPGGNHGAGPTGPTRSPLLDASFPSPATDATRQASTCRQESMSERLSRWRHRDRGPEDRDR